MKMTTPQKIESHWFQHNGVAGGWKHWQECLVEWQNQPHLRVRLAKEFDASITTVGRWFQGLEREANVQA